MGTSTGTATRLLRSSAAPAQFARFVLAGGTANLAYALVFLLLADAGQQRANLVGAVVSAVIANELHRRLTFRAGGRVAWWTAQWQGGATFAAGLTASSLGLAALGAVTEGAGPLLPLVAAAGVSGVVGLVRFVVLRRLFAARSAAAAVVALPAPADHPVDRPLAVALAA